MQVEPTSKLITSLLRYAKPNDDASYISTEGIVSTFQSFIKWERGNLLWEAIEARSREHRVLFSEHFGAVLQSMWKNATNRGA